MFCLLAPLGTGSSSTMNGRFLLSCINMCYHNEQSRRTIIEVISWSMQALSLGVYPSCDPWGYEFSASYEPARFKRAGLPLVNCTSAAACGIL
ncbi:unnamed protein product, partial [Symbiodinium microadriaticum]